MLTVEKQHCTSFLTALACLVKYSSLFFSFGHIRGGGALNIFSGRGVRPRFPKCGACDLTFASEKGGLWAENFHIWGLVSGKYPNLGACELKISKFWGLWAKIWVKIEAVAAKISKFSQKGVLWTDSFAWNGTLASGRRGVKRGSSGRTSHTPFLGQCLPRGSHQERCDYHIYLCTAYTFICICFDFLWKYHVIDSIHYIGNMLSAISHTPCVFDGIHISIYLL